MKQFSYKDYTRNLLRQELNRLHLVDGYPFSAISKLTGITESKLRAVSQGDRFLEDWEVLALIRDTANDSNIRFLNLVLPCKEVDKVNGMISDEITDSVNILSKAQIAYNIKDKNSVLEAAEELIGIADRMKNEAKIL